MKANVQRYLIALSLGVRCALAAVNGAAQPYPESAPAVSSLPPSPGGLGGSARAMLASLDAGAVSGQVAKGPPLTLYHGEVQVLDLSNVASIEVGDGQILRAAVLGSNQVVLIGESSGTTSLRVWTRNGTQFSYQVAVRRWTFAW